MYLRTVFQGLKKQPVSSKDSKVQNPYLCEVIRLPLKVTESEIPVGFVSPSYGLAEHYDVALLCLKALVGDTGNLDKYICEIGLSELGEWMNFRILFPSDYSFTPNDGHSMEQRLECFNSVDGSSRLQIRISWIRLICLNGLSLGETKEISNIHNENINLNDISNNISELVIDIARQKEKLRKWTTLNISDYKFKDWINHDVAKSWGIKAACRVYHICACGKDIEFADPFEKGLPTDKTVKYLKPVPGSPSKAKTYHDVAQALSWIATNRNNAEERHKKQSEIERLLSSIEKHAY